MKKDTQSILFWGSLWGITESVLGYGLHLASVALPGLPGFVLFPLAFFFMQRAYLATCQTSAVFSAAVVAALIKMTDFLVPNPVPILIVNPALALLLESAAVAVIMIYRKDRELRVPDFFAMGIVWRGVFLLYMLLINLYDLPAGLVTSGPAVALRFLFVESVINAGLMFAITRLDKKAHVPIRRPLLAYTALAAALLAQFFLP